MYMRRFELVRTRDVNGVSGTGVVVAGVQFANGQVAMQWNPPYAHINIAPSIESVIDSFISVHSHDGATTVRWLDPEANQEAGGE